VQRLNNITAKRENRRQLKLAKEGQNASFWLQCGHLKFDTVTKQVLAILLFSTILPLDAIRQVEAKRPESQPSPGSQYSNHPSSSECPPIEETAVARGSAPVQSDVSRSTREHYDPTLFRPAVENFQKGSAPLQSYRKEIVQKLTQKRSRTLPEVRERRASQNKDSVQKLLDNNRLVISARVESPGKTKFRDSIRDILMKPTTCDQFLLKDLLIKGLKFEFLTLAELHAKIPQYRGISLGGIFSIRENKIYMIHSENQDYAGFLRNELSHAAAIATNSDLTPIKNVDLCVSDEGVNNDELCLQLTNALHVTRKRMQSLLQESDKVNRSPLFREIEKSIGDYKAETHHFPLALEDYQQFIAPHIKNNMLDIAKLPPGVKENVKQQLSLMTEPKLYVTRSERGRQDNMDIMVIFFQFMPERGASPKENATAFLWDTLRTLQLHDKQGKGAVYARVQKPEEYVSEVASTLEHRIPPGPLRNLLMTELCDYLTNYHASRNYCRP